VKNLWRSIKQLFNGPQRPVAPTDTIAADTLIDRWFMYPISPGAQNDMERVHLEDRSLIPAQGVGIVYCLDVSDQYLILKNNNTVFRAVKEGVRILLPAPPYIWGEPVKIKAKPEKKGQIHRLSWHYNRQCYFYTLLVDGKIHKKRFYAEDLLGGKGICING
jgi:hypothetical protein